MVIITRFNVNDIVFYWHKDGTFKEGKVSSIIVDASKRVTLSTVIKSMVSSFTPNGRSADEIIDANMKESIEISYSIDKKWFLESKLFMNKEEAIDSIRIFK